MKEIGLTSSWWREEGDRKRERKVQRCEVMRKQSKLRKAVRGEEGGKKREKVRH